MNPTLNFSFFTASKQTAIDNASFAFGKPIGAEYGLGYSDNAGYNSRALGICGIRTALTVGNTDGGFEAPINKATRSLYTRYWERNSSISNFQPQDMVIYYYGGAQCVALLGWLINIYGVRKISNANSQYSKNAIWLALGVDPKSISLHLTDLRGYINNKIIDLKNIRLDKDVPLLAYASEMYRSIYMDSPNTSKTQYYVIRPSYVLKYMRDTEEIGSLTYDNTLANDDVKMTYEELTTFIDGIWAAYFNSAYIADISAAIGKALQKSGKLWEIAEIDDAYQTTPFFDARALTRLKNATVIPGLVPSSIVQNVTQQTVSSTWIYPRGISSDPSDDFTRTVESVLKSKRFLHAWSEKTQTPEESMVTGSWIVSVKGTAFPQKNVSKGALRETAAYTLDNYGFEIVTGLTVFSRYPSHPDGFGRATTAPMTFSTSGLQQDTILRMSQLVKEFDFFPTVQVVSHDAANNTDWTATIVDTDDYVVLSDADIYKLHRTAIYAILGVPAEG